MPLFVVAGLAPPVIRARRLLSLTVSASRAQIANVTDSTSTPVPGLGHDYIHMLAETVNPANGSVSLRIHVPLPPGRNLTLPFAFAYDSNGVQTRLCGLLVLCATLRRWGFCGGFHAGWDNRTT
jgi:hypothetical protein